MPQNKNPWKLAFTRKLTKVGDRMDVEWGNSEGDGVKGIIVLYIKPIRKS